MEETRIKYPIGEQDFKLLREGGFCYIDKTRFVEKIMEGCKYHFLARPRRFGKSLFLSTLQYFFKGEKELFKDLYIEKVEKEWLHYPVLRLDLNTESYEDPGHLDSLLDHVFRKWETEFELPPTIGSYSSRFQTIIEQAHAKTGLPVVILVDEYDKPLVVNINNKTNIDHYRQRLSALYSNFKSSAAHIRLVFLTGVSRFGKLSIFSDLNNLRDITFLDEYADICGITEAEMYENLWPGIEKLAKIEYVSDGEILSRLKDNYDGYKFAKRGSDIYNPWSLLNALNNSEISNYWNDTGMPKLVAETLKRVKADLQEMFDTYCTEDDLKGLDLLSPQPLALLFQTGYLTIKEYHHIIKRYQLGIPNNEVKEGLLKVLLPYYVGCLSESEANKIVSDLVMYLVLGEPDKAMKCLQSYFAGVHYKMRMDNENNFHNAFFILMDLLGLDTEAESATSDGSIDLVIKTKEFIYVIELKYDGSAEQALKQIEDKRYSRKFRSSDSRKIIEIGVNFSSKTRCIEDWKIILL